jgi:hypothetical protein
VIVVLVVGEKIFKQHRIYFFVVVAVNLRRIHRIVSLSMLATVGTFLTLLYPNYMLLALFAMFALLTLSRHLNLYKIAAMIKKYARVVSTLKFEIRLKLHMGFRDNGVLIEDENRSHTTHCSCIR